MATNSNEKSNNDTGEHVPQRQYTVPPVYGTTKPNSVILIHPPQHRKKSIVEVYLLAIFLGYLGAHHFYLRRPLFGVLYLFTFGLFGVGYVFDLFRIPCLVEDEHKRANNPSLENKKSVCDAYLLWFPFGLLGFHHFYLRKPAWGVIYMLTLGLFGFGWIVDLFRIPYLVKKANDDPLESQEMKSTCAAYIFAIPPFGLLGTHHYYLNRPLWGLLYTFKLGMYGIGWIIDLFRMPTLVKRANLKIKGESEMKIYLDDAYIAWLFPIGILGGHHFYLGRPGWGILYFLTLGIFGIGWLIDLCRMPCLVKERNEILKETRRLVVVTEPHMNQGQPTGTPIMCVDNSAYTGGNSAQYQGGVHPDFQPTGQPHKNAFNSQQQFPGYSHQQIPAYPQQQIPNYPEQHIPGGYVHPNVYPPPVYSYDQQQPPPYTEKRDEEEKK